jgi:hypothetical protein
VGGLKVANVSTDNYSILLCKNHKICFVQKSGCGDGITQNRPPPLEIQTLTNGSHFEMYIWMSTHSSDHAIARLIIYHKMKVTIDISHWIDRCGRKNAAQLKLILYSQCREVASHSGGSLAWAIMARSLFSRLGTACLFVFVRY